MHLWKKLTCKGESNFQNPAPNLQRYIIEISTELINYEYIFENSINAFSIKIPNYKTLLKMTYVKCVLDASGDASLKTKGHFSIFT